MKKYIRYLALLLLVALAVFALWQNTALELNRYEITSPYLPSNFSGFRIAHVSDLHNAQIGEDNQTLLRMLESAQPDMIAITGDLLDSRKTDTAAAMEFISQAVKIAPCYYVSGNHEARVSRYEDFKEELTAAGVTVLENNSIQLFRGEDSLTLIGLEDPSFTTDYLLGDSASVVNTQLEALAANPESFNLLLSHRPELFDSYASYNIDLALSGHAHGGQFRLPWVGGLVAPNQGLFPQYDAGLFTQGRTHMIVSRGIGNSLFPLRFCNPPEVILIELKTDL